MVRAAHRALQGRPLSTEDALARLPYTPEQISGFWLKVSSCAVNVCIRIRGLSFWQLRVMNVVVCVGGRCGSAFDRDSVLACSVFHTWSVL